MAEGLHELAWIGRVCEQSTTRCPADLLEELMSDPACAAFGPVHHVLVGAAMLAAVRNARGEGDLSAQLVELHVRASAVPGGACARWGVCGAAASCGMALAILLGNAPLKTEGWSEAQLMVSDILAKIAHAGAPRCCKRDSRIAVREATPWFSRLLGVRLAAPTVDAQCAVSDQNTVCEKGACAFFSPCA